MKSVWFYVGLGGFIGGLIPSLFGADFVSVWGFVGTTIGSFAGIWFYHYLDL